MEVIKVPYKFAEIQYSEWQNQWDVYVDGSCVSNKPSLSDAKKFIDAAEKKDFQRFSVIVGNRWRCSIFSKGIVTSIFQEEKETYAWVSCDGKRSKENIRRLIEDTEENWSKIKTILELRKQADEIESHADQIERDELTRVQYRVEGIEWVIRRRK